MGESHRGGLRPSSTKGMLLYISSDELSYIYEPHGTQGEVWDTTLEGSEMLKASGWKPFEMHRVSRHLHLVLISGGHLVRFVGEAVGRLRHSVLND